MSSLRICICLTLLLSWASPEAFCEEGQNKGVVRGEGASPGAGPAARESAILNAQVSLVMERLEQLIPSRDFSLFANILENAPAYFESYTVVAETHLNDATQVEIEGRLLDARILADAASEALDHYAVPPCVVVSIAEQAAETNADEPKRLGTVERKLGDAMRKARFDIVDADTLREDRSDEALAAMAELAPEEVAAIGREYRADIVLVGRGTISAVPTLPGSNLNKITCNLKLRVIRAIDGAVLSEPATQAIVNSADISEGANQALQDAADKALSQVLSASVIGMLDTQSGDAVTLTIDGLRQKERLDPIVAILQKLPGVDSVETAYASADLAKLKIAYSGRIGRLVDRLASAKFEGFHLDPHTVVNRAIMASVKD
ncbi:MAG: hypothetical protein WC655_13660 [Candidatus Hydrogenedentales bacterium]|jgi:hypothetical protein